MVETYPVDIQARDLGDELNRSLTKAGFNRTSLEKIHNLDRSNFTLRDARKIPGAVSLTPVEKWRSPEDYLLFDHPERTLAYIRPSPNAQRTRYALPFEIHFRTAAPEGFAPIQYFSLAIPQRNLSLLLKALQSRGDSMIAHIADLEEVNILQKIPEQAGIAEGEVLPVRLFHSTYVSRKREESGGHSDRAKAIESLSRAIGSVIVATHLFSGKQMAYYEAAAKVDQLFGDSALVG